MKQTVEYEVLARGSTLELMRAVNTAIGRGWRPFGGVAVSIMAERAVGSPSEVVMQAMVKYK